MEVMKYHKFISVVVIDLSARSLNTGPADRLDLPHLHVYKNNNFILYISKTFQHKTVLL